MNQRAIVISGAFQYVKNYDGYDGVDIWLSRTEDRTLINVADCVIAHSIGANYLFSHSVSPQKLIVLVNPLFKKKSFFNLVVRDIRYLFSKEMSISKIVPVSKWPSNIWRIFQLSRIDIAQSLKKISKDKIVIIRGRKDTFFCDSEAVKLMQKQGYKVIEVNAGHDWNMTIAQAVKSCLDSRLGTMEVNK